MTRAKKSYEIIRVYTVQRPKPSVRQKAMVNSRYGREPTVPIFTDSV